MINALISIKTKILAAYYVCPISWLFAGRFLLERPRHYSGGFHRTPRSLSYVTKERCIKHYICYIISVFCYTFSLPPLLFTPGEMTRTLSKKIPHTSYISRAMRISFHFATPLVHFSFYNSPQNSRLREKSSACASNKTFDAIEASSHAISRTILNPNLEFSVLFWEKGEENWNFNALSLFSRFILARNTRTYLAEKNLPPLLAIKPSIIQLTHRWSFSTRLNPAWKIEANTERHSLSFSLSSARSALGSGPIIQTTKHRASHRARGERRNNRRLDLDFRTTSDHRGMPPAGTSAVFVSPYSIFNVPGDRCGIPGPNPRSVFRGSFRGYTRRVCRREHAFRYISELDAEDT